MTTPLTTLFLLLSIADKDELKLPGKEAIRSPSTQEEYKVFELIPKDKKQYWMGRYYSLRTAQSRWDLLGNITMYWSNKEKTK